MKRIILNFRGGFQGLREGLEALGHEVDPINQLGRLGDDFSFFKPYQPRAHHYSNRAMWRSVAGARATLHWRVVSQQ